MTLLRSRSVPTLGVFLFLQALPSALPAQTLSAASVAYPILSMSPWARGAGMGNCSTAVADDLSALHINPAGLCLLPAVEVSLAHNSGIDGGFTETLGVALGLGETGTLGFSAHWTDYGAVEERDNLGTLLGTYHPADLGLRAGFGFTVGADLHLGLASHWIRQDLDGLVEAALAWDLGLLATPDGPFRWGASLRNLGLESGGEELATELTLGGSFRLDLGEKGEQSLLLSAEGGMGLLGVGRIGVGGEYSFRKEYYLRGGYSQRLVEDPQEGVKGLSLGAGIRLDQVRLDYSFSFHGELGNLNRLSLTLDLPEGRGKSGHSLGNGPSPGVRVPPGQSLPPGVVTLPAPSGTPGTDDKKPVVMKFQLSSEGDLTAQQLLAKGEEKWRLGLQQEALDCFLKAVEKDPNLDRAWELLGRAYLEKSLGSYRKLLEKHPENDRLRRWLDSHQRK